MTGVNDMANGYEDACEARGSRGHCKPYRDRGMRCPNCPAEEADYVRAIAEDVWHPASEPPTEADADGCGMVVVAGVNGRVMVDKWQAVHPLLLNEAACKWARVRDVVLMPEGE